MRPEGITLRSMCSIRNPNVLAILLVLLLFIADAPMSAELQPGTLCQTDERAIFNVSYSFIFINLYL